MPWCKQIGRASAVRCLSRRPLPPFARGNGYLPLPKLIKSTILTGKSSVSVGVDGPRRHRVCQTEVVTDLRQRRPSVEQISRIGLDTSKHIFQLHGVNAAEEPVLRKKLRRKEMFAFFEKLAP